MSIYKGGYILADISDTQLTNDYQDLLPQDLKDYMLKYIVNNQFNKEILMKPIKLLVTDINGCKKLVTLDTLSVDYMTLYNSYIEENKATVINVDGEDLTIACSITELQTQQ